MHSLISSSHPVENLDTRETSIFFDRENKYFPRFRFCKTDFRAHSEIEIINWIIFILHQFQDVKSSA